MRLINVETLKLEEFFGDKIPRYAILSHTWGASGVEVSFQDIQTGNVEKAGKIKLIGCCEQAKKDGLGYAWIDTCCIDKTNSVELGEAINSMFEWYRRAFICYAYLWDVPPGDNSQDPESKFFASRWFRRGWTLQELLAPEELHFYNRDWKSIGTKDDMSTEVEMIVNIPRHFLIGWEDFHNASVAQRMSWAAKRETTREEDIAYCLLGIFNVTMPMIYGEGRRALYRLQQEIMNMTGDHSILAWGLVVEESTPSTSADAVSAGVLAPTPSDFANCGHIVLRKQDTTPTDTFNLSGGLLRVQLSLHTTPAGRLYGLLNCGPARNAEQVVGIPLYKTSSGEYLRPQGLCPVLLPKTASTGSAIPVPIHMSSQSRVHKTTSQRYWLRIERDPKNNLELVEVHPAVIWERGRTLIATATDSGERITRRYLVRFRSQKEGCLGFIVVLELEMQGSQTQAQSHVMTATNATALKDLSQKLLYLRPGALGKKIVSNGIHNAHLTVEVEHIAREPIFAVKLTVPPFGSMAALVDGTFELEKVDRKLEFMRILLKEDQVYLKTKQLGLQIAWQADAMDKTKDRLTKVEEELRLLFKEQKSLTDDLEKMTQPFQELTQRHDEAEAQLGKVLERKEEMQQWLDRMEDKVETKQGAGHWLERIIKTMLDAGEIDHFLKDTEISKPDSPYSTRAAESGHNIDGQTPLSWAMANGHDAVKRVLLEKGADVEAEEDHSEPLLAVAIGRETTAVKGLVFQEEANREKRLHEITSYYKHKDWDSTSGCTSTLTGHRTTVFAVAWSADSRYLASASTDNIVKIWEVASGCCLHTLRGNSNDLYAIAWSTDKYQQLALASMDHTVKLWKFSTNDNIITLVGHSDSVLSVAWSADCTLLASGSVDKTVKVWDVASGRCISTLDGHSDSVVSVVWLTDSTWLASASADTTIKIWEAATGGCVYTLEGHNDVVRSIVWSADLCWLASVSYDKIIKIWEITTGRCISTLEGHGEHILSIAWSSNSAWLASTSFDETIKIWEVVGGRCIYTLNGHRAQVNSVDWSPNMNWLASGSQDNTIKIWSVNEDGEASERGDGE